MVLASIARVVDIGHEFRDVVSVGICVHTFHNFLIWSHLLAGSLPDVTVVARVVSGTFTRVDV